MEKGYNSVKADSSPTKASFGKSLLGKRIKLKKAELIKKIRYFTEMRLKGEIQNIENPEKLWLDSIADLLTVTKFFLEQFADIEEWDEAYKKVSRIYLREHADNLLGCELPNFLFNFLSTLFQARTNIGWFFKILSNNKKIYLKIFSDYRDPVIKIYFSGLFAMLSIKSGKVDRHYFNKSVYYLKKTYPFCLVGKDDSEQFDSLLRNFKDAYNLRLGLKKFATLHSGNITITFRNFN